MSTYRLKTFIQGKNDQSWNSSEIGSQQTVEQQDEVPFMITRQMKHQLSGLGYKAQHMSDMTPAEAYKIIKENTTYSAPTTPSSSVAASASVTPSTPSPTAVSAVLSAPTPTVPSTTSVASPSTSIAHATTTTAAASSAKPTALPSAPEHEEGPLPFPTFVLQHPTLPQVYTPRTGDNNAYAITPGSVESTPTFQFPDLLSPSQSNNKNNNNNNNVNNVRFGEEEVKNNTNVNAKGNGGKKSTKL